MLGSNTGPLQLVHWQSDALTTRLDLIRFRLDLIRIRFFMVPQSLCISAYPKRRAWAKKKLYTKLKNRISHTYDSFNHLGMHSIEYIHAVLIDKIECTTWGRILGRNPDKKVLRVFLLAIHSHLYSFALNFHFSKLTQPLTVSVKEKGGKTERKTIPPFLWFKKSIQKPQIWELSRFCPETSIKNGMFMNSASGKVSHMIPSTNWECIPVSTVYLLS